MQTYSPQDVSLLLGVPGVPGLPGVGQPIFQLAKGTFITVEYDSDAFTDEVGSKGDVVRIKSADQRGTIKFSTMAESASNATLSALAVADRLTNAGVIPVTVKDGTGFSLAFSPSSWIKKIPNKTYATEHSNVDWEIRCSNLTSYIGGT